jgi:hypothetical protein
VTPAPANDPDSELMVVAGFDTGTAPGLAEGTETFGEADGMAILAGRIAAASACKGPAVTRIASNRSSTSPPFM